MHNEENLSCEGKANYSSHREAAAAATVAKHQHGSTNLRPYHCPHCDLWHLASYYEE